MQVYDKQGNLLKSAKVIYHFGKPIYIKWKGKLRLASEYDLVPAEPTKVTKD
jgi:hypothetical protein